MPWGGEVKRHRPRRTVAANGSHLVTCRTDRRHLRFPLRMPVLCGNPEVPGPGTFGNTLNVSRGGLLLEMPEPLVPGTRTRLLLVAGSRNARAEATVVWMAEDTPYRIGVRFTAWSSGTDRLVWERLLAFQAGPTARAAVRLPSSFVITCRIPPDSYVAGRAENISDAGLMIALDEALALSARVRVAVPPRIMLSPVEVETEVMWARADLEGHSVLHGLRFVRDDVDKELFIISALLGQDFDAGKSFRGRKRRG